MSNKKSPPPFPSEQDIKDYLRDQKKPVSKRDIAKAFQIAGDGRVPLKRLLRDMMDKGMLDKGVGQTVSLPKGLPDVTVIEVYEIETDGDTVARPTVWDADNGPAPKIYILPDGKGHAPLAVGDRALTRVRRQDDGTYEGKVLKRLDDPRGLVIGTVRKQAKGYFLAPADKKSRDLFLIPEGELKNARDGDLAVGEIQPGLRLHQKHVRIVEVIGSIGDPKAISLIAIYEHGIRNRFPDAAINETKNMDVPKLGQREDLRSIPLVTIDGADARDFDDAVFAEADTNPQNAGGYHLIVAIADVSHYVKFGSALDKEAFARGNSTYFPDRVVPMLPEALSNGLCSLVPKEERACLAMHLWIDKDGRLLKHRIVRGLMKSAARLTYEQVQAAHDGNRDAVTDVLYDGVIEPLYAAFRILLKARNQRGSLDLDMPERKIIVNDAGEMTGVAMRERYDSHRLIEEFMVLANVAAAEKLKEKNAPCIYRIHDRPSAEKVTVLSDFMDSLGYSVPKGQVIKPFQLNQILRKVEGKDEQFLVNQIILRSQSQAIYSPNNIGHFGLALADYAHFTSPIRRYSDLIVHRSLIRAYGLGDGGLSDEEKVRIDEIAEHISITERQSMLAERDSVDRFTSAFLSEKIGAVFEGRISGVGRPGLFVTLNDTGADGLVPMRTLPDDFYVHDETNHALIGKRTRRIYQMCAPITVRLVEADAITGSTLLEVVDDLSHVLPNFTFKPMKAGGGRRDGKRKDGRNPSSRLDFKKKRPPKGKKRKNPK